MAAAERHQHLQPAGGGVVPVERPLTRIRQVIEDVPVVRRIEILVDYSVTPRDIVQLGPRTGTANAHVEYGMSWNCRSGR